MFLSLVDDDALKIGFEFSTPESNCTVAEIIAQFDVYAVGAVNETFERYVLKIPSQGPDEPIEKFLSSMRVLVKSCNYCENCTPLILRDRIVLGVTRASVQSALLKEPGLTLQRAVDACKASEKSPEQHLPIQGDQTDMCAVHHVASKSCRYCGHSHPPWKCPAFGKTCKQCGK